MGVDPLLIIGALSIAAAGVIMFFVFTMGGSSLTGVARSLEMIETEVSAEEVGRSELAASDRLITPFFAGMRRLALRLSPAGTAARLTRLLDLAGNPAGMTVEKLLGFKGVAMLLAGFFGIFIGGPSLRGLLFGAAGGAAGFLLPDLMIMNIGAKRQDVLRRGLADALDMLTVCVEAG